MNTDYKFEFILNNNDGAFIYYENLLTGKLERTNYDRRIMDWLLNTNIETWERNKVLSSLPIREK